MRTYRMALAIIMMAIPATVSRAQIIINEVMQNPAFVGDTDGEWFELYNQGATDVDINGWTIRDLGTNQHVINHGGPLPVPAGGYLVLGKNSDPFINGNVPVGYSYGSSITLGNSSDQIILEDQDGVEIDRVEYDDGASFPDPDGASMELISPSLDNNVGLHWSEAITSWGGNDLGTPGAINSVVDSEPPSLESASALTATSIDVVFSEPVDQISAEQTINYSINNAIGIPVSALQDSLNLDVVHLIVVPMTPGNSYSLTASGIKDITGNTMSEDSVDFVYAQPPGGGDIIITEIMQDPDGINDSNGEWFEVYNRTESPIDMTGWRISDNGSNAFTISGPFIVPAKDFALFVVNTDSATNDGLAFERMYDWGSSSTFTLGNTDDEIIIRNGLTTIDSVVYDGGVVWPDTLGASMGLADFTLDNNVGTNWTIAHLREPAYVGTSGNLGSPGTLGVNQNAGTSADIQVTPDSLIFYMGTNDSYSLNLTIGNLGLADLVWSVSDLVAGKDCPWLTETPTDGVTSPGEETTVVATADAAGLSAGNYQCTIFVSSNDPDSPVSGISVVLNVLDAVVIGTASIAPDLLPIPAAGDTVPMNIFFSNKTGIQQETEMWITLVAPGDSVPRFISNPRDLTVAPFDSVRKEKILRIPAKGPAGGYELTISFGTYPSGVVYDSSFTFRKSLTSEKNQAGHVLETNIPSEPFLEQNYPNPFNPATEIRYGVNADTWITLKIYNLLGQELATLVDEFQTAGAKSVEWNGKSSSGSQIGSGIYIYRMTSGRFTKSGKMIMIK